MLLNVQYRMHPAIREFPSKEFYHSQLADGPNINVAPGGLYNQPYHRDPRFKPFVFYDILSSEESRGGSSSYQNIAEATLCLEIYRHIVATFQDIEVPTSPSPPHSIA